MQKEKEAKKLSKFLKQGYIAYDENGSWWWYEKEPEIMKYDDEKFGHWILTDGKSYELPYFCFNILPFDGDWKKSLKKVG